MTELYGPDISKEIINEFIKKGVDFYVKLEDIPACTNTYPIRKPTLAPIQNLLSGSTSSVSPLNSISLKLDPSFTLKADCMILFPNNKIANTVFLFL